MITAKIDGMEKLNRQLRQLANKAKASAREDVIVGFTQRYAIWVHEVQAQHEPGKQWKYLESPARTLAATGELMRIVREVYQKTQNLTQAMLTAGLRIQREAQNITPIDTGALKASAFTTKQSQLEAKAAAAFARSEAVRLKKKK